MPEITLGLSDIFFNINLFCPGQLNIQRVEKTSLIVDFEPILSSLAEIIFILVLKPNFLIFSKKFFGILTASFTHDSSKICLSSFTFSSSSESIETASSVFFGINKENKKITNLIG